MKILLITHFFPPRHNAGTENYTFGLALAFQSRGHDVRILCAEDWDSGGDYWNDVTEDIYNGVKVTRIHLHWLMANDPNRILYNSEPINEWISMFLQRERFDIVHITSTASLGVGIIQKVKEAGVPLVLTLMDFWFVCPSVQLLRSDGELCDGVTTASQCQSCMMGNSGMSKKLNSMGISPIIQSKIWDVLVHWPKITKQRGFRGMLLNMSERKRLLIDKILLPDLVLTHSKIVQEMISYQTDREVKLLKNGHELSWLKTYTGKTSADHVRVGYIGQITSIKGVHVLVDAFTKAKLGDRAKLYIWGSIEKDLEYVKKLRASIIDDKSVYLCGRFEHDQIASVLSNIDVLVVPSIWYENAPLVIQEAFAAETPVISSNLGGMKEAISHNIDGLLYQRGNVDDLALQLQRVVDEPGLLYRLKSGIPEVKNVDEEVGELEFMYLDLIK